MTQLIENTKTDSSAKFSHFLVDEAYESLYLSISYLDKHEQEEITDACHFGDMAHIKDKRKSGEPYITHPFAVAEILAGFRMCRNSIIAAILHDTVEDTDVTLDDLRNKYGESVATLVDGVTKLKSSKHNKAENKAATFHKILLSTLDDPRVLLIKLSDRLHNMSTLGAVRPEKQKATAKETLDFYIPFARIMGMNDIADYIELLCYRNLDPDMYNKLSDKLLQHGLGRNLRKNEINGYFQRLMNYKEISGHINILDSKVLMFRQFFKNRAKISELLRQYSFEVVLDDLESCKKLSQYLINKYDIPKSGISDNISHPLPGGNQSLSITYHNQNDTICIVILTKQMQLTSKLGIIRADNASEVSQSVIQASLRNMKALVSEQLDTMESSDTNTQSVENDEINLAVVTIDKLMDYLHSRKILCYSPRGKAYELPRGATALDFAYAVGPFVGNIAVSALINGVESDLASVVSNGQEVNIITDKNSVPKAEWLGFVGTSKARELISKWLDDLPSSHKKLHGMQALDRALQTYNKQISDLTESDWDNLLDWRGIASKAELYEQITSANLLPQLVVSRLFSDEITQSLDQQETKSTEANNLLATLPGVEISFPKCCNPIYGDPIIGYNSSKHGLVVHRHKCYQLQEIRDLFPSRIFHVQWRDEDSLDIQTSEHGNFRAYLELDTLLSENQMSEAITRLKVLNVGVEEIEVIKTNTILHVFVQSRKQLKQVIAELRNILEFVNIRRLYHH